MNCVGGGAIPHRRQQELLQPTTVHRILRESVTPVDAARFAVQKVAVGVVVGDRCGRHGDSGQLVTQSQFVEFTHGVRQQVDADAQRAKVRAFDDGCAEAAGMQRERGGQPAYSGPGNENLSSHDSSVGRPLLYVQYRIYMSNIEYVPKL
jgi:hypothetical protein